MLTHAPSVLPEHPPLPPPAAACYACPALDAATLALQDTLTVSLYRLAAAFGDGLAKVGGWVA